MTELAIDLAGPLYKNLRSTGLAPPDDLVIASVRAPTSQERLDGATGGRAAMLQATVDGKDVTVVTVFHVGQVREVWMSVVIPRHLERATPIDTLEFFAMRFGVIFAIDGEVHKFARGLAGEGTPVIEPLEDGTCAFILFAPVQEADGRWTLPLVFGLDLDHYARWRRALAPQPSAHTTITIHPAARSIIQDTVLVDARASFLLVWDGSADSTPDLEFFRVTGDGFELAAGIEANQLFLERNGARVTATFPAHRDGDEVAMLWGWTPQQLRVATLSQLAGTPPAWTTAVTPTTFAPRHLVAWSRHDRVRPAFLYEDAAHVQRTTADLLLGVGDKLQFAGLAGALWRTTDAGARVAAAEADVRAVLDGLLFEACAGKHLQCAALPGDALGFILTARLLSGAAVPVCVTFARAADAGFTARLLAAMDAHGSDLGVHAVLAAGGTDAERAALDAAATATGRQLTVQQWDVATA